MAKRTDTPAPRAPSRAAIVALGALLGGVWGTVMWLIFELAGRESGVRGWAYLAVTMAMIGCGVAAIFGAAGARRRGERIGPRLGRRGRR